MITILHYLQLLESLMDCVSLQVEDPSVQRKALAEFDEVYQAIAVSYPKCGHAHSSSAQ